MSAKPFQMNRRTVIFVVVFLVAVGGFVFLLWPPKMNPYRLRIVSQVMEQGKPVMFFRI